MYFREIIWALKIKMSDCWNPKQRIRAVKSQTAKRSREIQIKQKIGVNLIVRYERHWDLEFKIIKFDRFY